MHCAQIVAGIAAEQSVTPDLVDEILAKTDGVPLFVEELTRAITESPTANLVAVPATLQDSLMARLDRLGPAKEIAQNAKAAAMEIAILGPVALGVWLVRVKALAGFAAEMPRRDHSPE